jgi:hypothetical protein
LFSADVSNDVDHVGDTLKELVKPFAAQATLKWILDNPRCPRRRICVAKKFARRIDKVVYRIIAERRAGGRMRATCFPCYWRRAMKTAVR